MKQKTITLARNERIIAVVPEACSGPGWANQPTWVYIVASDGKLRSECIQPGERGQELASLWGPGEAMTRALMQSISVRQFHG